MDKQFITGAITGVIFIMVLFGIAMWGTGCMSAHWYRKDIDEKGYNTGGETLNSKVDGIQKWSLA